MPKAPHKTRARIHAMESLSYSESIGASGDPFAESNSMKDGLNICLYPSLWREGEDTFTTSTPTTPTLTYVSSTASNVIDLNFTPDGPWVTKGVTEQGTVPGNINEREAPILKGSPVVKAKRVPGSKNKPTSCSHCRRAKRSCDRMRPSCNRCTRLGKSCTYESSSNARGLQGDPKVHNRAVCEEPMKGMKRTMGHMQRTSRASSTAMGHNSPMHVSNLPSVSPFPSECPDIIVKCSERGDMFETGCVSFASPTLCGLLRKKMADVCQMSVKDIFGPADDDGDHNDNDAHSSHHQTDDTTIAKRRRLEETESNSAQLDSSGNNNSGSSGDGPEMPHKYGEVDHPPFEATHISRPLEVEHSASLLVSCGRSTRRLSQGVLKARIFFSPETRLPSVVMLWYRVDKYTLD